MLDDFARTAVSDWQMQVRVALSTDRPKVAILVSKQDHCFHDLLHRFRGYNADLVCTYQTIQIFENLLNEMVYLFITSHNADTSQPPKRATRPSRQLPAQSSCTLHAGAKR